MYTGYFVCWLSFEEHYQYFDDAAKRLNYLNSCGIEAELVDAWLNFWESP